MDAEIESTAAADLAVEEVVQGSQHTLPVGAPCPNCAAPLQGPWCHACGQKGERYHRSIWHLVEEAFEGLTHFDGRMWRTLDRLVRSPGRLTRDYLDGHRAPQVPPFRMFLVVVLIVFLSGSLAGLGPNKTQIRFAAPDSPEMQQVRAKMGLRAPREGNALGRWAAPRLAKAAEDPETMFAAMERWGHQFAILSILVAAPLLTLAFVFQRQFFIFDHLIFSMHSLAFQGLLVSIVMVLGGWLGWASWLLLAAPVHLFFHMRGAYQRSVAGTLARMAFLLLGSAIGFTLMIVALLLIGLSGVH